jgi:hypothetical protein
MWREDVDASTDDQKVLTGPVGDTLVIYAEPDPFNPPDDVDWTTFTWTGDVAATQGGPSIGSFTVADNSTITVLDVEFSLETDTWEPDVELYCAVVGTDGTQTVTLVQALLRPTEAYVA